MQTSSSRRSPRLVLGLCLLPALLGCNRAPKATVERPFLDAAVEVASPQPAEAAQPVTYGEAPGTASAVVKAEETVTDHVLRAAELARRGFATEAAAELRTAATLAPNDPRIAAALAAISMLAFANSERLHAYLDIVIIVLNVFAFLGYFTFIITFYFTQEQVS